MEIRQMCSPRHATVVSHAGEELFLIKMPAQTMGFDTESGEGKLYKVDFTFIPHPRASQPLKIDGSRSISYFSEFHHRAKQLHEDGAKYLCDDTSLMAVDLIEGAETSVTAFYKGVNPTKGIFSKGEVVRQAFIKLIFMGISFGELAWQPNMFAPLAAMASAFEDERDAFESKMQEMLARD